MSENESNSLTKNVKVNESVNEKHESVLEEIKSILSYKTYTPLLPMICLYIAAGYMPGVFMAAYGAEWFALQDCDSDAIHSQKCTYNYTQWTLWNSFFLSLRGVISFLFAGYIGRLSDAFGRKRFLYLHIITNALPILALLFWYNMYPYFFFYLFGGLNGSNNSATPIMIAYISDIIPSQKRTVAFGLMYVMGGLGLFMGAISAILISVIWSDYVNFLIITMIYFLLMFYTFFFINESLSEQNRKPLSTSTFNPFEPLTHITAHPIVYKCCIISFVISLPETGVIDTAIPYMLDQLQINDKTKAHMITGTFILICGLGMVVCNSLLLPYLKKRFSDYEITIIGSLLISLSMFMFAVISWIPHIVIVCLTAFVLSLGFMVFPSLYSIATKYLSPHEQGIGMGIIFACRGLTYAIAPFCFAYLYSLFKSMGFPSFPYIIATVMCLSSVYVIVYSLKPTIDFVDIAPDAFCLSMTDLTHQRKTAMMKKRMDALQIYKPSKMYCKVDANSSGDEQECN